MNQTCHESPLNLLLAFGDVVAAVAVSPIGWFLLSLILLNLQFEVLFPKVVVPMIVFGLFLYLLHGALVRVVMESLGVYVIENMVNLVNLAKDLELDVLLKGSEQANLVSQPPHLLPLMMTRVAHT